MTTIRLETPADRPAILEVHRAAFGREVEAVLVERLWTTGNASPSLVAEEQDQIVGHILFSPVTIDGQPIAGGLGLAPLAVIPDRQRRGIGGALIRAGLAACCDAGCGFVVVIGHPEYYPRFGFERACPRGLANEYGADEAFMVIELQNGVLPAAGGLVRYGAEFAELA